MSPPAPAAAGVIIDALAWYCADCGALRHGESMAVWSTSCLVCGGSRLTGRGVARVSTEGHSASG